MPGEIVRSPVQLRPSAPFLPFVFLHLHGSLNAWDLIRCKFGAKSHACSASRSKAVDSALVICARISAGVGKNLQTCMARLQAASSTSAERSARAETQRATNRGPRSLSETEWSSANVTAHSRATCSVWEPGCRDVVVSALVGIDFSFLRMGKNRAVCKCVEIGE
jgi:hypothetical protein